MTREELNDCICRLDKFIEGDVSYAVSVEIIKSWLVDIRDNGVTKTKKYTIEVIKEQDDGFLTLHPKGFVLGSKDNEGWNVQSYFTQKEINVMRENPNLAIDWSKVIIKPVEDNDDEKEV